MFNSGTTDVDHWDNWYCLTVEQSILTTETIETVEKKHNLYCETGNWFIGTKERYQRCVDLSLLYYFNILINWMVYHG